MSSSATMEKNPIFLRKKSDFAILKTLYQSFMDLHDHIYFSVKDLQTRGVRVSPFNLSDENKATALDEPQFFQPIPDSVFKKWPQPGGYQHPPFEDEPWGITDPLSLYTNLNNYFHKELPEDILTEEHYSLLTFSKWIPVVPDCDKNLGGNRYNQRPLETHEWQPGHGFGSESKEYPHLIFFSMHGLSPDSTEESKISRSELLSLTNVLMWRLRAPRWFLSHAVYPVLMLSIHNRKIRLIQAHFDGKLLRLQCSSFLDFSTFNKSKFDFFLRWALSNPAGNTKISADTVLPKDSLAVPESKPPVGSQRPIGVK